MLGKLGFFLPTLGFRRISEMFVFDEWVSRATLSIFRFMPTLG